MRYAIKLGLLLLCTTSQVQAAILRPMGTLTGNTVKLSDLFDDMPGNDDRVLGPSPAPGGRIVVEAAQLAAIARQFGVDWRPNSAGDRVVLERPGRMLGREELTGQLRAALIGVGAPEDADLDIPGLVTPLIPAEAKAEVAVEQLDYQGGGSDGGKFTASVLISGAGIPTQRLRVAGTVTEMVDLPALSHRLLPGAVILPGDLQTIHVRASSVRNEVVRLPDQAIGQAVRRTLLAGQTLALADLGKPMLITKGMRVSMQLITGSLTLLANGQAMEPGALGERISVLNPTSRAVVEAEVIGNGRVRVVPESTPIVPPGGTRVSSLSNGVTIR